MDVRKMRRVVSRFSGIVDDETLALLTLYAMGEVSARGTVRRIRLFLRNGCKAFVDVDVENPESAKSLNLTNLNLTCTLAFEGDDVEKITLASPGSEVEFSGRFSGDTVKPERFAVVKPRTFRVEGEVVRCRGKVFCVVSESGCFCCYCSKCSDLEGKRVEVTGAVAERNVLIVHGMRTLTHTSPHTPSATHTHSAPSTRSAHTQHTHYPKELRLDDYFGDYLNEKSNVFTPIGELDGMGEEAGRVCISGRVSGIGELRKFRNGEFASLHISDRSGRVRLMLWNDVEVYRRADIGDRLDVFGGWVERKGEVVLHCDEFTILDIQSV